MADPVDDFGFRTSVPVRTAELQPYRALAVSESRQDDWRDRTPSVTTERIESIGGTNARLGVSTGVPGCQRRRVQALSFRLQAADAEDDHRHATPATARRRAGIQHAFDLGWTVPVVAALDNY
jgi:hypothetical protein